VNFKLSQIDFVSFGLGFILATLLWLIIRQISKLLPQMRKMAAENRQQQQHKKELDREHGLRVYALRKAQSAHLASALFSLEKILIEPNVITPVKYLLRTEDDVTSNAMYSVLPDLPEVPELVSDLPVIKNSLLNILQAGEQYIAVSAGQGYGKTTTLAALTSQLCLQTTANNQPSYLPIFLDSIEIDKTSQPARDGLINYLANNVKGFSISTLRSLLSHADINHRLVITIDGLDRLTQGDLNQAIRWIKELQASFPNSFFVLACDPFVFGDLGEIGFKVFSLSVWEKSEKRHFISQWKNVWLSLNLGVEEKERVERTSCWLLQEEDLDSPLELTLRIWAAFNGIAKKANSSDLVNSYLNMTSGGWLTPATAEALAQAADETPFPVLSKEKAFDVLKYDTESVSTMSSSANTTGEENKTSIFSDRGYLPPRDLIELLVGNHFFTEIAGRKLLFTSQSIFALLVSKKTTQTSIPDLTELLQSPLTRLLFENRQLTQSDFHDIDAWLARGDAILRRDHYFALAWLQQTEKADPLREKIFKQTARLIQEISLPVGLRYRFLYALVKTRDASISSLFNYLSNSADTSIRQISALGLGLLSDEKMIPQLIKLSGDSSIDVQKVACVALSKIWNQATQRALVDVVFSADDCVRALACELISMHVPEGHQLLQELTSTDNYLARKAAIYGLLHIQEPWVNALFEKLSIEDTQWVVRDAAKFALEHPLKASTYASEKLIPVLENPWTLQRSENYKVALPEKGNPVDLLFTVLEKDSIANKQIALDYLLSEPTSELIAKLIGISANPQAEFREEAINALFRLSKRGLEIKTA
jgi:HEAT repeat protein